MSKKTDIKNVNVNFDKIDRVFQDISVKCAPMMPLVSKSLELTRELLATYKKAFNNEIQKAKEQRGSDN